MGESRRSRLVFWGRGAKFHIRRNKRVGCLLMIGHGVFISNSVFSHESPPQPWCPPNMTQHCQSPLVVNQSYGSIWFFKYEGTEFKTDVDIWIFNSKSQDGWDRGDGGTRGGRHFTLSLQTATKQFTIVNCYNVTISDYKSIEVFTTDQNGQVTKR